MGAGAQLTPHERGLAMAGRVEASVARHLGHDAATMVRDAVVRALLARHQLDPRDPQYLHPGRTVLILLDDVEIRDTAVLAAGAVLETRRADLAAAVGTLDESVRAMVDRIPRPDGDDVEALREALITADPDARVVALAERLDHARHLHLEPETGWEPLLGSVRAAYLPVAEWHGGLLGARYRRWADAFERRIRSR